MRLFRILCVSFLVSLSGLTAAERAVAETEAKTERHVVEQQPPDMGELSKRLDEIISRALDAEVLSEPRTGPLLSNAGADRTAACSADDPFDFAAIGPISDYADLQALLHADAAPGAKVSARKRAESARAWLAAGLSTEAMAELGDVQDPESEALRSMAALIEGRTRIDLNVFRRLAYCHESAAIWLGAALLLNDAPEGVILLTDRFADIRALPLPLRGQLVSSAFPGLLRQGHKQLAMKLMAVFSEDEIRVSSQLRFCRAQLDLAEAKPGAREDVLRHLFSSRDQGDALAALTVHAEAWTPTQTFVLKQDAIGLIARHRSESELYRFLKFLLDREGEEVGYKLIAGLLNTSLNAGSAREAAVNMMTERLKIDLQSDAPVIALSAVQFIKDRPDLFTGIAGEAELYDLAIRQAAALGYEHLSLSLAQGAGSEEMRDALAASVAFRRMEYEAVFKIAGARPDQEIVQLLAARAAIRLGDPVRLSAAEKKIKFTPDTARVLVQEDVLAGHWIVPEALFDLANKDADDATKDRLAQIGKIRAARTIKRDPAEAAAAVPAKADRPASAKDMFE